MLSKVVVVKTIISATTRTDSSTHSLYDIWDWLSDKLVTPAAVGLVLALAGLFIARSNEKFKAQREHVSSTVEALRAKVDSAVEALITYWNQDYAEAESPPLAARIEYLLQDISGLIGVCDPDLWTGKTSSGRTLFENFTSAATGPTFNSPDQRRDAGKVMSAVAAAAALLEGVSLEMGAFHRRSMFHRWVPAWVRKRHRHYSR